jgi:glycosyltransferase involved in cell wall biosynthesis
MLRALLKNAVPRRIIKDDIVVIDSVLPNKNAIGPRNSDLLELICQFPCIRYYTMYPMKPGPDAWFTHGYGMQSFDFKQKLRGYVRKYPESAGKIRLLSPKKRYQFKLAYTYFLAETYTLLPFLEKNEIPFVFLLNPGGAFGVNNESSDKMLRAIFASKYFRKVIVNQKPFEDYLLRKKLCGRNDVLFDFSGSVQFKESDVVAKRFFKHDKQTFDICFVAAKYSPKGVDKGYDLFIAAAKQIVKFSSDVRFHVVGGFSEDEIDVSFIKDAIKFYGYLPPAELPEFYANMDIYLSPNRPFKLYEGGSDGFPLSAGAMYCGVCGFNTDELHMNTEFKKNEVVIIKPQAKDIVEKVKYFYNHTDELYAISRKGQKKAQKLYDLEAHIKSRIQLFEEITRVRK